MYHYPWLISNVKYHLKKKRMYHYPWLISNVKYHLKKKRMYHYPWLISNVKYRQKKKECIMFAYYLFTPVVFLRKLLFMYSKVYLLTSSRACE